MRFRDRRDAGQRLAKRLSRYDRCQDAIVLALPRGGVPVGFEVARCLGLPLDVLVVCKLGAPGCEELSIGAVTSGGISVLESHVIEALGIPGATVRAAAEHERRILLAREMLYRGGRPGREVAGWTVILVDDGLATGSTMRAAATALRRRKPARIVVGLPVAREWAIDEIRPLVDEIVCMVMPDPFETVGRWYADPAQMTDDEVRELLDRAYEPEGAPRVLTGV